MENTSITKQAKSDIFKELHPIIKFYINKGAKPQALKKYYKNTKRFEDILEDIRNKSSNLIKDESEYKKLVREILNDMLDDFIAKEKDEEYKNKQSKNKSSKMEHIKKFENFQVNENVTSALIIFGALALLKIIYNTIKRKILLGGIKKSDFSKLEYLVSALKIGKSDKKLLGKIIDNQDECQIIYQYGALTGKKRYFSSVQDNTITFHLNKIDKILTFGWDFIQPIFPFIKFNNEDSIVIKLTDEDYKKISDIFKKLKHQKFKGLTDILPDEEKFGDTTVTDIEKYNL